MSAREIDHAGRPTNRAVWLARLCVRLCQIFFWVGVTTAALPFFLLSRRGVNGAIGAALTFLFQRLGATFIKIGQIMSTRPDIFSSEMIEPLTKLQDQVPPVAVAKIRRAIEEDFGRSLEEIFVEFDPQPVASASVAQVHRAVLQEAELPPTLPSRIVAVKVRRPGIVRRAYLDEAILRFGARLVSWVPTFSLISPLEAVSQFCEAVNKQLDFRIEADNNRHFRGNFESDPYFVFPAIVDQLASDRVLTMEFIEGVKIDKIRAIGSDPSFIARKCTEGAAKMIFHHGFIHADLHAGNVFFLAGNRVALVDLGLVGVLTPDDRRRFALFTYYMFSGMGAEAARWLHEAAGAPPVSDYAAYEDAIGSLVSRVHNRPLEQVQMTAYVIELYDILRRHRLRFEATFTMANIAMVVMEGIARKIAPKLNVSREVRPYLESALALSPAGPSPEAAALVVPGPGTPISVADGRYRVRRLLGEGVRKRVYLARDKRLERDVALAFIRTEGLDDAALARINLEARAVARLADHPRIVPVYDSGEEAGVPYVVSQYMRGGTLSSRLLRASEHRLPLETTLRVADQILQALEHAHAHGVVHRDVKPENIWLTEDGFAKLGDFGLARTLGRPEGALEGMTVGTALYMSPEQALGRGVDHRSDLYSLGATLYELLTGRPPFEGESVAEVIARHINVEPQAPSRRNTLIPPALDAIVLRLLAKLPEHRFESAAAARQALRDVSADTDAAATTQPEISATVPAGDVFVGREQEIARLRKSLEEALAGYGRFVVLVGEPGIGKTRVAELLASYASRRGSQVLTGRSFEGEGAPAYWPWVQILRAYIEDKDSARLDSELGAGAPYVAQIVPQLREPLPDLAELGAVEGEEARFRLFDAVTSFLRRAAMTNPLFLLLDDLHWADKPSLLLLQFVTRELAGARIFIVGTYRDVDVQHGHPLAEVLPSLRRERAFERILLRGLPEDDVRLLIAALAGADVPEAFVRAIYRETEGNPFFIEETLRHLMEEGVVSRESGRWESRLSPDEMGLPEGVREVIGRRLARLSEPCRRILTTASVLGRDFDTRVLEQVAGVEPDRLLELLEEAMSAQIVEPEKGSARHRFSHALIRETLYAELGAAERVRLHRRIADALHWLYADDTEAHLSELAYHFFEAAPTGDVDRAIEFATRAAEYADRQFAYEEAANFYDRAVRALETKENPDEGRRSELLVGLGIAQWRSAEFTRSKETMRLAAEAATRAGRAEVLARAAIAYSGEELQTIFAAIEANVVPMLEKALAALPVEDGALRAIVMGRLAGALFFTEQQERRWALFEEASQMARRVGDKRALASVIMNKLLATWGAGFIGDLVDDAVTFFQLANELGDERLVLAGTGLQGIIAGETGDLATAATWFAETERRAAHHPHYRWFAAYLVNAWLLVTLKPDEAEKRMQQMVDIGVLQGNPLAVLIFGLHKSMNLWHQGRFEEAETAAREFFGGFAKQGRQLRSFVLTITAMINPRADSRELLETIDDLSTIHRDTFWLTRIALTAFVVEAAGDVARAETLYDALVPHDGRAVVTGGAYCFGSVSRYLGLLAKVLSRFDDAVRHYEGALHFERQMPLWLARTQLDYARVLALRAAAGDRARALALLRDAIEGAQTFGMKQVAADAVALKLELEGAASASTRSSIDAVAASIEAKGIDLARTTAPDGTVTLVFSAIEGFSEMTERLGDSQAHRAMRVVHEIVRAELRANGGNEIEEQADAFLLAFRRAGDALRFAIAVQKRLAQHREQYPDPPIHVRIGLNTGEPIREGKRFFGKTVILAARIAAHAAGDEILVSSVVRELVETTELGFDEGEEVALPGLAGVHRIYAVLWDPEAAPRRARPRVATPAVAEIARDNVFRREGDYWTIAYRGHSFRLKDAKGVQYIAALLRRPGEPVHVTDLMNGVVVETGAASAISGNAELEVTSGLGDAGEVLDAKARSDYRERLESLRAELEEARDQNDLGRTERLRQEIDFITQELASAFGLGGRARRSASAVDRARKAVSSRVSDSIARIGREHSELGAHFDNSIRLGLFCRYAPEKPVAWSL